MRKGALEERKVLPCGWARERGRGERGIKSHKVCLSLTFFTVGNGGPWEVFQEERKIPDSCSRKILVVAAQKMVWSRGRETCLEDSSVRERVMA